MMFLTAEGMYPPDGIHPGRHCLGAWGERVSAPRAVKWSARAPWYISRMNVDPTRCPLCQGENACGMQKGEETCWCMQESIPPSLLARIPAEAKDKACVCVGCVRKEQQRTLA